MSNTLKNFGRHLHNLRHRKGLSQERLSELAGLHRTYLSSLERGERNPTLITLLKISKALKITLPELINFKDISD